MKPPACSRRGIIGDVWGEMGEIVTFSKAFAEVESDDDISLAFELGYSKTLDNTGRSKGSVKIGTFPLHTGTCPLHTDIFFRYENWSVKRTLRRKLASWKKQGFSEMGQISTFSYVS